MRKKKSLTAVLFATTLVFAAQALGEKAGSISSHHPGDDWLPFGKSGTGDVHYIHADSISVDGTNVEAWQVTNLGEPQIASNGKVYNSTRSLNKYDCKKRTVEIRQISAYTGYGTKGESVHFSQHENEKPTHIPPGTIGYDLLNVICGKSLSGNRRR